MQNINTNQDGKIWFACDYTRLSREDGDKDESDSITNQKELIRSFVAKRQDISLAASYEDDGYSGVDFNRPSFKRMIEDIKAGKVNCVIVKDLSRLGRNYIETGKLLERFFPFMGVRFIAINDSYDSLSHNAQTDNLIIPFKNLINDAYCADISKKVRSQFDVRRKNGDFIGAFPVFGYGKDPDRKNHLVIDEDAAAVVRDIFTWKIAGMNQQGIANKLNTLGVLSPLEYKKAHGSKFKTVFCAKPITKWTAVSVGRVLANNVYIGVLTQGKNTTPNYKIKQRVRKAEDEWVRVEQAHEPIISTEDFALVAHLMKKDTRITPGGDCLFIFSGILFCGDCGRSVVRKPVKTANTHTLSAPLIKMVTVAEAMASVKS
jgi:DNA invertase Pin-like site-specific DNA recombinase